VKKLGLFELTPERLTQRSRQHRAAIFFTFAIANRDLTVGKIQILDPQLQAFHQPQP
jgi:hypothetical protein